MKYFVGSLITFALFTACSHHQETTQEAKAKLESKFEDKIGSATKGDLIEYFGNAEWCKIEDSGRETCRFYRKTGVKWVGEKEQKDKKAVEKGDQIIAEFDKDGVLQSFKASAQR
jgi:hypothetical protein